MTPRPWTPSDGGEGDKRHAPATLRNRDAIAAVLGDWLPASGTVLEVASGSGEHAVHFASALPARESTGIVLVVLIGADIVAVTAYRREVSWPHLHSKAHAGAEAIARRLPPVGRSSAFASVDAHRDSRSSHSNHPQR